MSAQEMPPPLALYRMITGFYVSRAIHVVAQLGILLLATSVIYLTNSSPSYRVALCLLVAPPTVRRPRPASTAGANGCPRWRQSVLAALPIQSV